MVKRNCLGCGKEYLTYSSYIKEGRRFCSPECWYAQKRSRLGENRKCFICGKEFYTKLAQIRIGRGKFCSYACYHKSTRTGEIRKCLFCGKEFYGKSGEIKKGNASYCCRKCRYADKKGKQKKCKMCEKIFYVPPSDLKNNRGKYCSRKCIYDYVLKYGGWNKGQLHPSITGKNHPNWQGGIARLPYPIYWTKLTRMTVRKRDKFSCQICGKSFQNLSIHHIDYKKNNCRLENLVALCQSCHAKTNFERDKWIKFFISS